MQRTIEALWNGEINPCKCCGEKDSEMEELLDLMERNKEVLNKEASEEMQKAFRNYIDCSKEYTYLITKQAFSDGFCLASRLLCEAL